MINVTKTYLPPLEEYTKYLKKIWENNWLTNNGPLLEELEDKIKEYLGCKYFVFITNGTIALQIAIKALGIRGEVITTPFTYIATSSSLVWEGCKPIFVDINRDTWCLDPNLIEERINKETSAIVATHIYGNACDVIKIGKIAQKYRLKILYDAAHTFGARYCGKSLASYGDASILSFHATKIFHTIEGGGIVTSSREIYEKAILFRNFGHVGQNRFVNIGINGKASEFQAAMGLCVLPHINNSIAIRRKLSSQYDILISKLPLMKPSFLEKLDYNYAYYPVVFPSNKLLVQAINLLNSNNIYPRRYFYPSLNKLKFFPYNTAPVSEDVSSRVLCLPFYDDLSFGIQRKTIKLISKALNV